MMKSMYNAKSDREYQLGMDLLKVALVASAGSTVLEVAGLVAQHYVGPETSASLQDMLSYSPPVALLGGFLTAYLGSHYCWFRATENVAESSAT